jgi:putative sterol carrier protein
VTREAVAMAEAPSTIVEVVEWLRKHFDAEAARGTQASYQYHLTGPGGGRFYARVDDGRLETAEGEVGSPDVSFRLTAADFFDVLAGRRNADILFMQRRIEVEGNLSLALQARKLFQPLQ